MKDKDVKYCPTCGSEHIKIDELKHKIKCLKCKSRFIYNKEVRHLPYGKSIIYIIIVQQR